MTYLVQGTAVVSCQTAPSRPEAVDQLQQLIETLEDVAAIEELSGRNIEPTTEPITFFQRVRLRQMRLLWQGEIVQWDRALPDAASPDGKAPSWIRVEADSIPIGGAQVPTPEVLIGHPGATWIDQGPVPESEPAARRFSASPPEGQRFVAWSPSRRGETDQQQWESVRWNLAGINEDTCPF